MRIIETKQWYIPRKKSTKASTIAVSKSLAQSDKHRHALMEVSTHPREHCNGFLSRGSLPSVGHKSLSVFSNGYIIVLFYLFILVGSNKDFTHFSFSKGCSMLSLPTVQQSPRPYFPKRAFDALPAA